MDRKQNRIGQSNRSVSDRLCECEKKEENRKDTQKGHKVTTQTGYVQGQAGRRVKKTREEMKEINSPIHLTSTLMTSREKRRTDMAGNNRLPPPKAILCPAV